MYATAVVLFGVRPGQASLYHRNRTVVGRATSQSSVVHGIAPVETGLATIYSNSAASVDWNAIYRVGQTRR